MSSSWTAVGCSPTGWPSTAWCTGRELRPLRASERAGLDVETARLAVLRGAADVSVEILAG